MSTKSSLLSRRSLIGSIGSAAVLPLMSVVPGIVQAQSAGLGIGLNRYLQAAPMYVREPDAPYGSVAHALAMDYFYTHQAQGVFIDVVPEPAVGTHVGICFNAAPRADNKWQDICTHPSGAAVQKLWYRGVGVTFFKHNNPLQPGGVIKSEKWIVTNGKPSFTDHTAIGTYPANTILRVTATTNRSTGQTLIAVYQITSAGQVVALLAQIPLVAEVIGDYAGVFAFGANARIQVQPAALFG